jgi:hypothetical protein
MLRTRVTSQFSIAVKSQPQYEPFAVSFSLQVPTTGNSMGAKTFNHLGTFRRKYYTK